MNTNNFSFQSSISASSISQKSADELRLLQKRVRAVQRNSSWSTGRGYVAVSANSRIARAINDRPAPKSETRRQRNYPLTPHRVGMRPVDF